MATTTAFGWETPDDTDLVKDGAAAIRTLGSSIDTSMSELKGGTTGQLLSKTSATDMDFTWTAPAVVPVHVAGKNGVLNSSFDIWQRGTSFAAPTSNTFVADRWAWQSSSVATKTISRQASGLTGFQYGIRVARDSGNTNTASNYIGYSMETSDAIRFAGQTVTFSFYAKAGANYSPTSSLLGYRLASGTGTDQNLLTGGYTGNVNLLDSTQAITTTYTRYSFTATVGSTATELGLFFYSTPTGTAGANDWFEITGVQLEIGSTATPFSRAGGTIQGELAACQRYYYQAATGNTVILAGGFCLGTTELQAPIMFPVTMRTAPSLVIVTGSNYYTDQFNGKLANTLTLQRASQQTAALVMAATGFVSGTGSYIYTNNASASVGFNSEL
jgi:hypothetical protein